MRSPLFWDVTHRVLEVTHRRELTTNPRFVTYQTSEDLIPTFCFIFSTRNSIVDKLKCLLPFQFYVQFTSTNFYIINNMVTLLYVVFFSTQSNFWSVISNYIYKNTVLKADSLSANQ